MIINFDQYGEDANKKPLIIIHGLYGSAANFRGLAKIYANDFIVFCIDLRNHGNSPHSDEITYSLMAEDVIEFMLVGASAVQLGTVNFVNPFAIDEIPSKLNEYCGDTNTANIQELSGGIIR